MHQIIANFEIGLTSFLDQDGNLLDSPPPLANNKAELVNIYQQMAFLRAFDTKAVNLQRIGKMGTYASTLGQEAIGTVIGLLMEKTDVFCPFYRDYGVMFQRGIDPSKILAYWGGDERGSHYFAGSEDFPICVPIASQCLHAAGIATAFKIRKQKRVAVTAIGDGGTSEGDFYEALNVAGAWNLPLVIVINNNQWAISVPRTIQSGAPTLAQKAIAAGIRGEQVDGNDALAMHTVFSAALTRARNGEGPTLIEAITYRLCDHTTADDARRYREDQELQAAWQREPISRLKKYLLTKGFWTDDNEADLQRDCAIRVNEVVERYLTAEKEAPTAMFDHLYAEFPESMLDQYEAVMSAPAIEDGH